MRFPVRRGLEACIWKFERHFPRERVKPLNSDIPRNHGDCLTGFGL